MKTDTKIQKNVMAQLKTEPLLNACEIGVAVKNGVVTLSGTVNAYAKKIHAEEATKKVAGVKAVAEEIEVHIPGSDARSDSEIAEAALFALKWHTSLPEDKIWVKVEKGCVILEGEVEWEFQKRTARRTIESIQGVTRVVNRITIAPKAAPKDVLQHIREAFHRSATVDSEKIQVETTGRKVLLSGKVRSWAEKHDAERAAWLVPGINEVDNMLEVTEILTLDKSNY